jgi:N-methylhydantoinase A/oxoprolinase/acetone carboxylase beta subunit
VTHRVYERSRLPIGATLTGPAIVEEEACTLVVGADAAALVDVHGSLLVTIEGGRR